MSTLADDGSPARPPEPVSLRERKKARTRGALVEVSQRLFDEQGYAATTLDQICAAVEITTPTLLRYFDSKARLALAPLTEPLDDLESLLRDPDRTVDTLSAWRDFISVECVEALNPTSATTVSYVHNLRAYRQWVDKDPTVVAMASDLERRTRDVLAEGFRLDGDAEPGDLHPALLAALLVGGRTAVWDRWAVAEQETGSLLDDQLAVIDYAVSCLDSHAVPRLTTGPPAPLTS